jgi:hypothetical protein
MAWITPTPHPPTTAASGDRSIDRGVSSYFWISGVQLGSCPHSVGKPPSEDNPTRGLWPQKRNCSTHSNGISSSGIRVLMKQFKTVFSIFLKIFLNNYHCPAGSPIHGNLECSRWQTGVRVIMEHSRTESRYLLYRQIFVICGLY